MTILWRAAGLHRAPAKEMLDQLTSERRQPARPRVPESDQPAYGQNEARAREPQYLVLIGTCTHLGCLPKNRFEPGTVDIDVPGGWRAASSALPWLEKFDLADGCSRTCPRRSTARAPTHQDCVDARRRSR